ncbi:MAG TPA: hypothetical protein PLY45_04660, partial [bacterium]|nr:hypothetical protein [bacterium]
MGGFFRQYSWVIDLVGILFSSFLLAKIAGVYLGKALEVERSIGVLKAADMAPMERKRADISEYSVIIERNMFDAAERSFETTAEEGGEGAAAEEASATGEAVKTSLGIKVVGVLVVGDGRDKRSTATVSGGSPGKGAKGDACKNVAGTPECGAELVCLQLKGSDSGTCTPYCDGADDCSGGLECAQITTDGGNRFFACAK